MPTHAPTWQASSLVQGLPSSQCGPLVGLLVQVPASQAPTEHGELVWHDVPVFAAISTHAPALQTASMQGCQLLPQLPASFTGAATHWPPWQL